jgi:hypothetical protein
MVRNAGVVDWGIGFAYQSVNIEKAFHKRGLSSRSLGALDSKRN